MRPKCIEQVETSVFHLVQRFQYTKLRTGKEAPWISPHQKRLGHLLFPYSVHTMPVTLAVSLEIRHVTNRRNSTKDLCTFLGSSKCPVGAQIPGCNACFSCSPPTIKISAQTPFSKILNSLNFRLQCKVRFHFAAA